MADQRQKDVNWSVAANDGSLFISVRHGAFLAVLMDQRDALKQIQAELIALNRLLQCRNFIEIPHVLRGIRRNTTKRKRKQSARE